MDYMDLNQQVAKLTQEERWLLTRFEEMCNKYPKESALVYLGKNFTYADLLELINRFANSLHEMGVKKGDRVLLYVSNSPQYVIAYLGLQKIGAVPVPVSPIYTPFEIKYMLNNSEAKVVICMDTNFGYVVSVLPETDVEKVIITNVAEMLPSWKRILGRMFDRIPTGNISKEENVYFFGKLLKNSPNPPQVEINPNKDLAELLYTGGTTGLPKGVPHTHSYLLSGIIGMREFYKNIREREHVLVLVTPLFHMFSIDMLFSTVLHKGNTAIIMPKPNIDAILDHIQRYQATLFAGVPTLYRMILEHDRLDMYDISSLQICWSAGDVLPKEVYNRWKEKFGIPLHQVYGSTETVCISVTDVSREPKMGSVGPPIPGRYIMLVDPETLEPVQNDDPGELIVSADFPTPGYWKRDDETAETYVKLNDRIWCRTGDYVVVKDGEIYFVDRRKDIIKYKGYRIAASEVEVVLQDHPAVIAASVVGVRDPKVGERVKAFVVLKEDARGVTAQELIRWCRERLAPYKVPEYIEFRDFLPKSKVGKVLRRELRDEEQRKVGAM